MRIFTLTVTEETGENRMKYDIVSDGFRKIEMIGILHEATRIVVEREKQKETEHDNEAANH